MSKRNEKSKTYNRFPHSPEKLSHHTALRQRGVIRNQPHSYRQQKVTDTVINATCVPTYAQGALICITWNEMHNSSTRVACSVVNHLCRLQDCDFEAFSCRCWFFCWFCSSCEAAVVVFFFSFRHFYGKLGLLQSVAELGRQRAVRSLEERPPKAISCFSQVFWNTTRVPTKPHTLWMYVRAMHCGYTEPKRTNKLDTLVGALVEELQLNTNWQMTSKRLVATT